MLIDTVRHALESVGLLRRIARGTPGQFLDRSYSDSAGGLRYKVYIPARFRRGRSSLLVMLHGCRQTPEDFATGTRMNDLADEHGFLVVYPAQSATANRPSPPFTKSRGIPIFIFWALTDEIARRSKFLYGAMIVALARRSTTQKLQVWPTQIHFVPTNNASRRRWRKLALARSVWRSMK